MLVLVLLAGCQSLYRPLPEGTSFTGAAQPTDDVHFLRDLTYINSGGNREVDQEIFDEAFRVIRQARKLIVIDMFLYNSFQGPVPEKTRALSSELTQRLIRQKNQYPDIRVVLITDPVNTVYGSLPAAHLDALSDAGVEVVITRLNRMRDSNFLYSPFWRVFIQPFGSGPGKLMPNPFGEGRVSLRAWLEMLNFKANHRKTLIADNGSQLVAIVASANPHDGSSAHGNVAVKFSGAAAYDLLQTENAVLAFSGGTPVEFNGRIHRQNSGISLQVITEGKIGRTVLETVNEADAGDSLSLAMFYLSNRKVIDALKSAHERGVSLEVLLDPAKDAFGRKKNGVPNRPAAREIHRLGIPVRWCDTHGEQCHAKMLLVDRKDRTSTLILGSANFTRRNLEDLNLETNVVVRGPSSTRVFRASRHYFRELWNNTPERKYSTDYASYEDGSLLRRALYRFMEATGMSTF